jgi:hypothetical protein
MRLIFSFLVVLLFINFPAYAEKVLTKEAIEAYYKALGDVQMKDPSEVVAFYDKHTSDAAKGEWQRR